MAPQPPVTLEVRAGLMQGSVFHQVGHLENCWSQLESLIQQKIQDSALTLEDLARVENQLKDAREWVEEQRPALTSVLKTSPPPDLAQNFLFDHLSVCVELEARQQLLGHAVSEAQAVASRLGLSEKRGLQELVEQAQAEVEALGAQVAQRRKYLSKVNSWASGQMYQTWQTDTNSGKRTSLSANNNIAC